MRTRMHLKFGLRSLISLYLMLACFLSQQTRTQATENDLKVVYAVNAGGYEHTDKNGIHYAADPLHNEIGTASDFGNRLLIIGRVPEQDEMLYRTERYHTATFGYDLPINGSGDYALIMKFCEVFFNAPNKKVFDVMLNRKHTIVSELDIFHQVGRGTAHEECAFFTIEGSSMYYKEEVSEVRSGFVRLEFIKGALDNPKINAFALLKGSVEQIPRLSPVSNDILPMDGDMTVFHDRASADNSNTGQQAFPLSSARKSVSAASQRQQQQQGGKRYTYTINIYTPSLCSSVILLVFIAIATFILRR